MDIERIGIALSSVLTHERDAEISLRDHNLIRMACNRIVEKADIEDIKIALCANPMSQEKRLKAMMRLKQYLITPP